MFIIKGTYHHNETNSSSIIPYTDFENLTTIEFPDGRIDCYSLEERFDIAITTHMVSVNEIDDLFSINSARYKGSRFYDAIREHMGELDA